MFLGTEMKSRREGKSNINDAFCVFIGDVVYIMNMHNAEDSHGSCYNHESKRDRVLLRQKNELKKLRTKVNEKGLTIVPLRIFISDRGIAKLEISVAQGKKEYDKRQTIKERDNKREIDRRLRENRTLLTEDR